MDAEIEGCESVVFDFDAIDADALIGACEVRRGVEPGAQARSGEDGGQSRSRGALSVGTCDEDGAKATMGVAEGGEEDADFVERILAPRLAGLSKQFRSHGAELVDRSRVGHGNFSIEGGEDETGTRG